MKTITIPMFVYFQRFAWEAEGEYVSYSFETKDTENLTFVCRQDVAFEVPTGYDPTAQKLAALLEQKEMAHAAFEKSVFEINVRISKLQALEYKK